MSRGTGRPYSIWGPNSLPIADGRGEADYGQEVKDKAVVPSGDAADILETAERPASFHYSFDTAIPKCLNARANPFLSPYSITCNTAANGAGMLSIFTLGCRTGTILLAL